MFVRAFLSCAIAAIALACGSGAQAQDSVVRITLVVWEFAGEPVTDEWAAYGGEAPSNYEGADYKPGDYAASDGYEYPDHYAGSGDYATGGYDAGPGYDEYPHYGPYYSTIPDASDYPYYPAVGGDTPSMAVTGDVPLYTGLEPWEIDAARDSSDLYWQTDSDRDRNIDYPGRDPITSSPGYNGTSPYADYY